MKKLSRVFLWTLGVIGAGILAIAIYDKAVPSQAVGALPKGATEIQEHYKTFGITGDFKRLLKARVPREEVEEYARKVGAHRKEEGDNAGREYLSWTGGPEWWSPKQPPLYYFSEKEYRILVGWEEGFLHFDVVAW